MVVVGRHWLELDDHDSAVVDTMTVRSCWPSISNERDPSSCQDRGNRSDSGGSCYTEVVEADVDRFVAVVDRGVDLDTWVVVGAEVVVGIAPVPVVDAVPDNSRSPSAKGIPLEAHSADRSKDHWEVHRRTGEGPSVSACSVPRSRWTWSVCDPEASEGFAMSWSVIDPAVERRRRCWRMRHLVDRRRHDRSYWADSRGPAGCHSRP